MESKEESVLELFFNSSKHWHFEELLKESKLSRGRLNIWLKKFEKEGIIKRIKENKKMPYYIGDFDSPSYKSRKRLFALEQFYESGFLNHLQSLEKVKSVIIFGSFSRADWYKESDIDIFIYGDDDEFEQGKYETKLKRDIQLFTAKNEKDLNKIGKELLKNILKGYLVKGDLDFVEVKSAKI